jgi:hypothetical protein
MEASCAARGLEDDPVGAEGDSFVGELSGE